MRYAVSCVNFSAAQDDVAQSTRTPSRPPNGFVTQVRAASCSQRQRGGVVAAMDEHRRERSATTLTPQWNGSAEALQRRADTKPLVSCSRKFGGTCVLIKHLMKRHQCYQATQMPLGRSSNTREAASLRERATLAVRFSVPARGRAREYT
jgi:hypothetical protein